MSKKRNVTFADDSSSAGSSSPDLNTDLLSLFECPVCFDYALPPIFQCESGHLLCSECRPKLQACPTCRGSLGKNIRNLALEKVANSVKFPCKYSIKGCRATLSHAAKLSHEEGCECRTYCCPCPGKGCNWQGCLDEILGHLSEKHTSMTSLDGDSIVFLATEVTLPGSVDWLMKQTCHGQSFLLVLEKSEKNGSSHFYVIVQVIGSRKLAQRYKYRVELNATYRHLSWESVPKSIRDRTPHTYLTRDDCLMFDEGVAKLFLDDKGNLPIHITISPRNPLVS